MMTENVSVKQVKNWARDNCPPLSWQRVIFRILPKLNNMGIFLHFFENDDFIVKNDALMLINDTFYDIFKKKMEFVPTQKETNIVAETEPSKPVEEVKDVKPEATFSPKKNLPENISVKQVKAWAKENCSAAAWPTVVLSVLPMLRNLNIGWQYLHDDNYSIDKKVLEELDKAFVKIFNKSLKDINL